MVYSAKTKNVYNENTIVYFVYANCNLLLKEFNSVWCYDFDGLYIYWYVMHWVLTGKDNYNGDKSKRNESQIKKSKSGTKPMRYEEKRNVID